MPQPDQTALDAAVESATNQLAEEHAAREAQVVELSAGATIEDAARIGALRGRHGFLTEIQL